MYIRISLHILCLASAVGCARQHDFDTLDAAVADAAVADAAVDTAMAAASPASPRPHTDEHFLLLRGTEEGDLNRLVELDLGREEENTWIEVEAGALERLSAGGGTGVVTWRTARGETSVQAFRGGEPIGALPGSLRYNTSAGGSTLFFTGDEAVVMDELGRELGRWPYSTAHPTIDPRHRWLLQETPDGLSLLDLRSGATERLLLPGRPRRIGRAWFGPDEVIVELGSATPELRYVAIDLHMVPVSARPLDLSGLIVADYDRCRGRLLTLGPFGEVVAVHARTGSRERIVEGVGLRPLTTDGVHLALAALSPDGRSLIWLAGRIAEWRAIVVADLARAAAVALPDPTLPQSPRPRPECEGRDCDDCDCDDSIEVGRFVGGFLSLGASSTLWGSAAYRVQLHPPALARLPHCGRTTPWVLEDGSVLVCQTDREALSRLAVARPGREPYRVTEGPVDLSVTPLDPTSLGCAASSPQRR